MTPREAICTYMGWDFSEAADYRYHYGRTAIPVYSTADGYVCATANGKKPPADESFQWVEATNTTAVYCKNRGKTVWVSGTTK